MSKGITVRVLARANSKVNYDNGEKSELPFHRSPDGAVVLPLNSGYVYVSNSKAPKGKGGGVYGLYFDRDGHVVEYKALLNGTTMNCGGGEHTELCHIRYNVHWYLIQPSYPLNLPCMLLHY